MYQVLYTIPLSSLHESLPDLPLYGYGTMLFIAFLFSAMILAPRLCRREGIPTQIMQDVAVWIFVVGIIGARVTYYIQYRERFHTIGQFFAIWDGGLVFYGGSIGGLVGYVFAYFLFVRKKAVSSFKLADAIAPCLALGLCLGRVGCLLNGCCYGNVACVHCPEARFPLAAAPRVDMTGRGYQTAAGFTVEARLGGKPYVDRIEKGSAAEGVLQPGDRIVAVQLKTEKLIDHFNTLEAALGEEWPRGQNDLRLTVEREQDGKFELVEVVFTPRSIGLHPTQIYETISMGLMTFFLLSYYPFKRRDGMVMVLCMLGYGVHRYLNEMLRTDTQPVAFGLTLSQNISILVVTGGVVLWLAAWFHARRGETPPASLSAPAS